MSERRGYQQDVILPMGLAVGLSLLGATPSGTWSRLTPSPGFNYQLTLDDVTSPKVTKGVLITTFAVLLASELLIVANRAEGHPVPTISKILEDWGRHHALLPYTFGVLAGHWWWNTDEWAPRSQWTRNAYILVSSAILIFLWDIKAAIWGESSFERSIRRLPIIPMAAGVYMGHKFWPQKVLP